MNTIEELFEKELSARKLNLSAQTKAVCLSVIRAVVNGVVEAPTPPDGNRVAQPFGTTPALVTYEAEVPPDAAILFQEGKVDEAVMGRFGFHDPSCFRSGQPCKHDNPNTHATYDPKRDR
jgi:hypothetical protein